MPAYPSYGPSYQTPYQHPYQQQQPARSNTKIIIAVVIIIVVVVGALGAYAAYTFFNTLPFAQHSQVITNTILTVQPSSYDYYQFTVPTTAILPNVSGNFTASGGSGNDIEVLVMDQVNFVNWQNNHAFTYNYDSGQVTTGNIYASLPGTGTYYLVYSNAFSSASTKTVQTVVDLNYRG